MMTAVVMHWFREDLRLQDNPALTAACAHAAGNEGGELRLVYVVEPLGNGDDHRMGAASRVWFRHTLTALSQACGQRLHVVEGDPVTLIPALAARWGVQHVYWNARYEPSRRQADTAITTALGAQGVRTHPFAGTLLWEPHEVLKADGTPYQVFTPFYRRGCLAATPPRTPLPAPTLPPCPRNETFVLTDAQLARIAPLTPWRQRVASHWTIGEVGAHQALHRFISEGLAGYKQLRNYPARPHVSRLSPHLHFGEISANQVWHAALESGCPEADVEHFCSELGWREFSHHLLYHNPHMVTRNLQPRFDAFPWTSDLEALQRWQQGQTGVPMVDAGMRELWQTGYMHNRTRMIVGSWLVKNLLLDWRHGARWFWDCLVDADLANNTASWQWIAGCGADAAPYFRIFNPVLQGERFDPDGTYIRTYVPELAAMSNRHIHQPWSAPQASLTSHAYPAPMVPLDTSRKRALEAFHSLPKPS